MLKSSVSASVVVPARCLTLGAVSSVGRCKFDPLHPRLTKRVRGNSVVITKGGFKYKSSERRTPRVVGTLKVRYIVTGSFTEVFFHGSVGGNLLLVRRPSLCSSVGRNSAVSIIVGRRMSCGNGRCPVTSLPGGLVDVVRTNKLMGTVHGLGKLRS